MASRPAAAALSAHSNPGAGDLGEELAAEIGLELEVMACRALSLRVLWVRRAWLETLGRERVLELVAERGGGELTAALGATWQDRGVRSDGQS